MVTNDSAPSSIQASIAFFFPPDAQEIRLTVTLTLVLSFVALKFLVAGNLPRVPYQTNLVSYASSVLPPPQLCQLSAVRRRRTGTYFSAT
jgi:hypothetical protein